MTGAREKIAAMALLGAVCGLALTNAGAATYHVSPFGLNAPPYLTYETAANHPKDAIDATTGLGDTVWIHSGVYRIDTTIDVPRGIVIGGDGSDSTSLVWYVGYEFFNVMLNVKGDNEIFDIRFVEDQHGYRNSLRTAVLLSTTRLRSLEVRDCRIDGMELNLGGSGRRNVAGCYFYLRSSTGCFVPSTGGEIRIHDNTFFAGVGFEVQASHGVFIADGHTVVENNVFDFSQSDKRGIPIMVERPFRPVEVRNNLLLGGDEALDWENGDGVFENNTVVGPHEESPYFGTSFFLDDRHSLIIRNNLWIDNGELNEFGNLCDACPPTSGFTYHYNAFWPPVDSFFRYWSEINPIDVYVDTLSNFNAFPMIADSAFRLQFGSPLIDAGDPAVLDADGSRSDIGLTGGPGGQSYDYPDEPPLPPDTAGVDGEARDVMVWWSPRPEGDLAGYRLFRGAVSGFWHPSLGARAEVGPTDTVWADVLPPTEDSAFYVVTAFDATGHESGPSVEGRYLVGDHPANQRPQVTEIPDQDVDVGDTLTVTILASDPDGDEVELAVTNLPARNAAFFDFGGGGGLLTFAPDTGQIGDHAIVMIASDGRLADTMGPGHSCS